MILFNIGDKHELRYSSGSKWGTRAGYVEIIAINRIPEPDLEFQATSIKNNYDALAGEVTFIVYSDSTNTKPKKAVLHRSKHSEEWAREHYNGLRETEWFCPGKRNYQTISTFRK